MDGGLGLGPSPCPKGGTPLSDRRYGLGVSRFFGGLGFVLASVGVLWCAGFAVLVQPLLIAPAGQDVDARLMFIPLALASLTWLGLHLVCKRDSAAGRHLAQTSTALLGAAAFVSSASVGMFVYPAVLALLGAHLLTPR